VIGGAALQVPDIDPATVLSVPELGKPNASDSSTREALDFELESWFGAIPVHRGAIWDVSWLDQDRVAAVHDDCLLEVHDLATGEMKRFPGDEYGAAILRTDPPIIHCTKRRIAWERDRPSSRLLRFVDGAFTQIGVFDGSYSFCASDDRLVLGRFDRNSFFDVEKPSNADLLILPDGDTVERLDLGHYDVFNHFIGIDGAPYLFFLQGTPPSSHKDKYLCRLWRDGSVERLWPVLRDDGRNASHAMECCGAYVADKEGESVVLSGCHYSPNPSFPKHGFMYRKLIGEDRELWRLQTAAAATTILHISARGLIAASFLDGTLMLLDAITGGQSAAGRVTVGGLDTVIFSMDTFDDRLAIGTCDGVVAMVTVDELLAQTPDAAGFELA
jgi:hypothetical protein